MDSVGKILAKSPKFRRALKKARPLTASEQKFLDAAVAIRMNPGDAEATFMARELVQCTLPHTNPGNKVEQWSRTNGNVTLSIIPGRDTKKNCSIGYPYGVIPRLLLFWMTTEAVRTKNRRLELGHNLSSFMREIGLVPSSAGAGKHSDARRLQEQMRRLFHATISFERNIVEAHRQGEQWLNMQVAPKGELWWDIKRPEQGVLWGSYVILGEDFYAAITAAPVPVDMRVLKAIRRSPLALDLYAWATWRVFRLQKPAFIPWDGLMKQMGAEYKEARNFVSKAKAALGKIQAAYPALKLTYAKGGMLLYPSLTAIAPAAKRTQNLTTR